jgi:hypothetical protein
MSEQDHQSLTESAKWANTYIASKIRSEQDRRGPLELSSSGARETESKDSQEKAAKPARKSVKREMVYVAMRGGEEACYPKKTLVSMWGQGILNRKCFYWTEGMTEWRPLPELFALSTTAEQIPESQTVQSKTTCFETVPASVPESLREGRSVKATAKTISVEKFGLFRWMGGMPVYVDMSQEAARGGLENMVIVHRDVVAICMESPGEVNYETVKSRLLHIVGALVGAIHVWQVSCRLDPSHQHDKSLSLSIWMRRKGCLWPAKLRLQAILTGKAPNSPDPFWMIMLPD